MNQMDEKEEFAVVPHEGTWIEMLTTRSRPIWPMVVPHEGTWIEIRKMKPEAVDDLSFPTRDRGLKNPELKPQTQQQCRSPRGNVD